MSDNQMLEELVKIRKLLEPEPKPEKKEEKPKGLWEEFIEFINKYGVVGLAIGFIIGAAAKDLVNALVDDILMPIILFFVPGGNWREVVWTFGPFEFLVGHFAGALLDFLVIALIIFLLMKQIKKTNFK